MTFFEWLASTADGQHHEVTASFVAFATVSLFVFGVLLAIAGRLVVDAWRALREERLASRFDRRARSTARTSR